MNEFRVKVMNDYYLETMNKIKFSLARHKIHKRFISYSKPPMFVDHGRYIVKINVGKLEVGKPG